MIKATTFQGYFRKIFLLFLIFILIPLLLILFIYLGIFSNKIRENYIDTQAKLIQDIVGDLDGTIDIVAKEMSEDELISFFIEQLNSRDDGLHVDIFPVDSEKYENLQSQKDSLPREMELISGIFYHDRLCYSLLIELSDEEIGFNWYNFIVIGTCLIITLLLTILAWSISKRLYEPIKSMYNSAIEAGKGYTKILGLKNDELSQLSLIFEELNHDARASQAMIDNYKTAISAYSLSLFLEGNISAESFLESNTSFGGNSFYTLVMIKLKSTNMAEHYVINMTDILEKFLGEDMSKIICPIGKGKIIILIATPVKETIDKLIRNLYDTIDSLAKVRYLMARSEPMDEITTVPKSYQNLTDIISTAEFYDLCRTIIDEEFMKRPARILPPAKCEEFKSRITKSILGSDIALITSIVEELFTELRYMDIKSMKLCYDDIVGSIVNELSLRERLGIDVINSTSSLATFDDYKTACLSMFKKASYLYNNTEITQEKKICMRAVEYLHDNYFTDIDFTILATELNLSYSYLSRIFKNTMNITLTDYLNTYRIDQSCRLLETTDDKLDIIAEKVGYNNSQSFQRFFKKYKGITPTEYRRMVITRKEI